MKRLFFTLLFAVSALSSLYGKSGISVACFHSQIDTKQTTVMQAIPDTMITADYTKVKYCLRVNSQTKPPVCVITQTSKGINIKVRTVDAVDAVDDENLNGRIIEDFYPNDTLGSESEEKLKRLGVLLSKASEDFDLRQTNSMFIILSVFEDLSISITEKYCDLYGETISDKINDRVVSLFKESDVFKGISRLLEQYALKVDEVYVDGFVNVLFDGDYKMLQDTHYVFGAFIVVTVILTRSIEGFRYP
ncbi:hypothetical protein [Porphyromonas gulae]|uniref:hypothetical protein n=1 Tax=Porphyromonas gulae TaxID=111105 RepID=UPI000B006909|nr:hypothetical protein [Porphyromonas gulae]